MLQDKVAMVTGAASGIGRAIAVEMAANGADVIAVDIAGKVSPASNAVVLFLFNVIETKFLRASPTAEFSHRLDPNRTGKRLINERADNIVERRR
jgi:nucleoside-diphosphate-sugar epimerase